MGAVHPAYIFAGAGPCILPSQVPALSMAVMAPHWANMPEMAPGPPGPELPALEATAQEEAEAEAPQEAPTAKPTKKASVTLRLVGFETAKKIAVVKEVRSMLGEGLKESKEKVESAPVNLKKGVPLEEAEALAEKLRAAGVGGVRRSAAARPDWTQGSWRIPGPGCWPWQLVEVPMPS